MPTSQFIDYDFLNLLFKGLQVLLCFLCQVFPGRSHDEAQQSMSCQYVISPINISLLL